MQFRIKGSTSQTIASLIRTFLIAVLLCVFSARIGTSYAQDTGQMHVVQPGEYLSTIASRYGVSVSALSQANGISNPDMLRVGQVLTIPSGGREATTAPPASTPLPQTETARPLNTPATQYIPRVQSAAPAAASAQDILYTVYPGESLSSIAAKYDTSVNAIIARNRLPSPTIYSGQRLIIPSGAYSAPQQTVPTATAAQPVGPTATPTQTVPRPTRTPTPSATAVPLRTIPRLILLPTAVATPANLRR